MTLTNEKIFFSLYSTDNNYFFSTKFSFKVMNYPKLKHLSILLRLLTSSILLLSGIGKQLNPMEFTVSLQSIFGLSDFVSVFITSTLPALEIIVAVGLLTKNFAVISLSFIRILCLIFVSVHVYTFVLNKSSSACNCFGNLVPLSQNHTFIISLLLVFITFLPYIKHGMEKINIFSGLISNKRFIFNLPVLILLAISLIFRMSALENELRIGLIKLATSNLEAKSKLRDFVSSFQNYGDNQSASLHSTLFLFLRSPGCDICQNELRFWNTGHFNKSVNLVAIFPQLSSEDTEKSLKRFFKRRSLWKHSLYLINNELYKELMGYKNYIGRVFVSNSNEILLCQGDQGSEVERYEFVSKIQNIVSLF